MKAVLKIIGLVTISVGLVCFLVLVFLAHHPAPWRPGPLVEISFAGYYTTPFALRDLERQIDDLKVRLQRLEKRCNHERAPHR